MRKTVALTGFMGSGKTTLGRTAAEAFGLTFLDTDEEIEKKEGMPIPEIFRLKGEAYFRKTESEVLAECSGKPGCVLSLGGGAVKSPENRRILKESGVLTVYLKASPERLCGRLKEDTGRPLLAGTYGQARRERIEKLLSEREEAYTSAADLVFDEDGFPEEDLAEAFIRFLGNAGTE